MKRLWFLVIVTVSSYAFAQQLTSPPTNASMTSNGKPSVWQPGTSVTVYIDGTVFPAGSNMETAVEQGFLNDQAAYSPNDGVTYTFQNVSTQPTLTQNTLYVTDASLPVDNNTGQFENTTWATSFNDADNFNLTTSGILYVNSALVDSGPYQSTAGVTYAASHGDSHMDGLGDCLECLPDSTVMSYENSFPTPGITGPQQSDVTVQHSVVIDVCDNDPCSCFPNGPGCGGGCPDVISRQRVNLQRDSCVDEGEPCSNDDDCCGDLACDTNQVTCDNACGPPM